MTETRVNISARAPYFSNTHNNTNEKSGLKNPENSDFIMSNGKPVKVEKHDEVLPETFSTKFNAGIKQASMLPKYAAEGLRGDKNANFFEFLQLGKIPYWVGGAVLAWCFAAGGEKSKFFTKQKAVGIGLYYVGAMAAKALVDGPVRFFKGIDLNRKYSDVVALATESKDGHSEKKTEYHNVYESIDLTRRYLLYKHDSSAAEDPNHVNSEYDKIALNMGLDKDLNDPDSTVKPYVKKLIVASRAWKSALIVPMAMLAAGLSTSDVWKNWGDNLGSDMRNVFKPLNGVSSKSSGLGLRIKGLADAANNNFVKPLAKSFTDLWSGANMHKFAGRAAIIAPIASVVLANLNLIRLSYLKEDKYIDSQSSSSLTSLTNRYNSFTSRLANGFNQTKQGNNALLNREIT